MRYEKSGYFERVIAVLDQDGIYKPEEK